MDNCIKHNLPFDEMGYCQPPEGEMSCSGWQQMQERIAELETEVEKWKQEAKYHESMADGETERANVLGKGTIKLRSALEKYGSHFEDCLGYSVELKCELLEVKSRSGKCTCGLEQALEGKK